MLSVGGCMERQVNRSQSAAKNLVSVVLALTLIGLVFIYSSSCVFALEKCGSSFYFLKKQLFFLLPSTLFFLFFAKIRLDVLRKLTPIFFFASLGLTLMTFVPGLGLKMHGSNRWINLGFMSFQPSELLKFFSILFIALLMERRIRHLNSLYKLYLPLFTFLGIVSLVLLKQPDFGSVVTLASTTLVMMFIAECNLTYLGLSALGAVPLVLYLILSQSYRLNRVLVFLNPWADPQGKGFQIIQSLIAISSGSIWGVGLAGSKQKYFYLPMQHTDFIFPIIAEEIGLIGCCFILILIMAICYFGFKVALNAQNYFSFFMATGFTVFITIQSVINVMVACGMLPTKGLGLPFISYGGTSLMCMWGMIGCIVNAARSR